MEEYQELHKGYKILVFICSILILIIGIFILIYTIYNNTRDANFYGKFDLVPLICFYICSSLIIISAIILMIIYYLDYIFSMSNLDLFTKIDDNLFEIINQMYDSHNKFHRSWYRLVIPIIFIIFISMITILVVTIISHASNYIPKFELWVYITVYVILFILFLLIIILIACYVKKQSKKKSVFEIEIDVD